MTPSTTSHSSDAATGLITGVQPVHFQAAVRADQISPGDAAVATVDTPYGKLANLICFDADFPGLPRQSGGQGVDMMLVPSNDWREFGAVHTQKATLRAIENGYSLVRQDTEGLAQARRSGRRGAMSRCDLPLPKSPIRQRSSLVIHLQAARFAITAGSMLGGRQCGQSQSAPLAQEAGGRRGVGRGRRTCRAGGADSGQGGARPGGPCGGPRGSTDGAATRQSPSQHR
jgi:hypothetical protein